MIEIGPQPKHWAANTIIISNYLFSGLSLPQLCIKKKIFRSIFGSCGLSKKTFKKFERTTFEFLTEPRNSYAHRSSKLFSIQYSATTSHLISLLRSKVQMKPPFCKHIVVIVVIVAAEIFS